MDDVETGATVLGLHFMYQPIQERQASTMSNTPSFLQNNNSVVRLVSPPPPNTVKLQWLKHLLDYENMFETGVVRANEC